MSVRKICGLIGILLIVLIVGACASQTPIVETVTVREVVTQMVAGTPQTKIVEVVVTPTPEVVTPGEKASPYEKAEAVRLGILADLDGLNPFYLYDITGSSTWNYIVTAAYYPTMFVYSDQRWDWVPQVAAAPPDPIVQEGDFYVGTVKVKDGLKWSDGSPLTAEDVAFTANTALTFSLSGNWVGYFNPTVLDRVEAVDTLSLKYYYKVRPGLPIWQYGALLGPIISKAYWQPKIADVLTRAEALDPQAADFLDQITPLQTELEAIPTDGEPTFGGIKFSRQEPGAYVENVVNDQYSLLGMLEQEYANGAYREINDQLGYDYTLYGDSTTSTMTLEVEYGPYFDSYLYPIYSQDAAYLALQSGEVDIVLNPSGVPKGVREQLNNDPNITLVKNAQNGFRYIEFNQARAYFAGEQGMALRQAIACMIDSKFLAQSVLQNEVTPVYTLVPEGNTNWYNPNVPIYCKDMTEAQRLNEAVRILKEAGFTWEVEPSYTEGATASASGYNYGKGIKLPDGTALPDLDFQAPGPGYDPLRATVAVHIEQWLKALGIPVTMNYTPFNTIRANENSGDFDIIMLGWGLVPVPTYLCDFFTGATGVGDGSDNISYVSPTLHQQCIEFYSEPDPDKAKQLVYDMQVTIATELPYITLFTNPIYDAYANTITYPYTKVFDGLSGVYGGWYMVMPTTQQ